MDQGAKKQYFASGFTLSNKKEDRLLEGIEMIDCWRLYTDNGIDN